VEFFPQASPEREYWFPFGASASERSQAAFTYERKRSLAAATGGLSRREREDNGSYWAHGLLNNRWVVSSGIQRTVPVLNGKTT